MKKGSSEGFPLVHPDSLQKVLVIGIGNEYRGDDGIGLQIARQIRAKHLHHLTVLESTGDGAALMEAWQGYGRVILVDAISSGAAAGTIVKIDVQEKNIPAKYVQSSTHAFGVAEAIALARAIQRLPPKLFLYGIVGASFHSGKTLSRVVQEAARSIVENIITELEAEHR